MMKNLIKTCLFIVVELNPLIFIAFFLCVKVHAAPTWVIGIASGLKGIPAGFLDCITCSLLRRHSIGPEPQLQMKKRTSPTFPGNIPACIGDMFSEILHYGLVKVKAYINANFGCLNDHVKSKVAW